MDCFHLPFCGGGSGRRFFRCGLCPALGLGMTFYILIEDLIEEPPQGLSIIGPYKTKAEANGWVSYYYQDFVPDTEYSVLSKIQEAQQ